MRQIPGKGDRVFKISILPLNYPRMGDFQSIFVYFWKKIFRQEENFPTGLKIEGAQLPQPCCHDAIAVQYGMRTF